jgi:hypothetical protein
MKAYIRILAAVAVVALMGTAVWATNVTFRVNMQVQIDLGNFDVSHDTLLVRGTFNGWGDVTPGPFILVRGGVTDSVWSGTWDITAGAIEYKFAIKGRAGGDVWEGVPNRTATVATDPLVIPVVYFNDVGRNTENVEIHFRVNMSVQQLTGNFDPTTDWIVVRGAFNGWGGASPRLDEETVNPGIFSTWFQISNVAIGAVQEYKFVILPAGDPNNARWESSNNRSFTPTGNEPDNRPAGGNGFKEIEPELVYFSNITPSDIITNDLNVVFQVEDHPLRGRLRDLGYIYDVQTHDTIYTVDNTVVAGFFNNWPWGNFGQDYIMNDNGINGDLVANDHIWSRSVLFRAGSPRECIYKYGCNMLDVEAGFAMNHTATLDDQHGATFYVPTVCWGAQDTLYQQWQSECVLAADDHVITTPKAYALEQNYPNPFNPITAITFMLPRQDLVKLRVFDLLGREAASFNYGTMQAGKHTVGFDGSRLASGLYFYRLETPNFTATKKMLLMK